VALDPMGSRRGDHVMLTSDGRFAKSISGGQNTPARWSVAGILDDAPESLGRASGAPQDG
ncbi:MAG: EutN/CcmL family microcompartment protein, partial [Planctomycetota bacterium]